VLFCLLAMRVDLGVRANRRRSGGKRNRLLWGGADLWAESRTWSAAHIYGQVP